MFKAKLMNIFKNMFGGHYSKENGKVFWSKEGFKQLVTTSFLKYFIENKKDPSSQVESTIVSKTVSTVVNTEVPTVKKPAAKKKAKKDATTPTDPPVS